MDFGKYLYPKSKNRGSWNRQCTGRRKAGVHRKTVYIRRNVPHKEILLPACNYDVWFDSISDFISIVTDGTDGQGNQCFSCSCGGSVCNAATRLCLPTAADKVGRVICVKVVLVVAVSAMLLLVFAPAGITTVCVVMMYACYGGIMGSFPSLSSSIFGMEHSGENYGYVMFGIAVATLSAPAITNTVLGNGYDINAVFASGAFSAALALISLILLEREIKKEKVNAC